MNLSKHNQTTLQFRISVNLHNEPKKVFKYFGILSALCKNFPNFSDTFFVLKQRKRKGGDEK